MIDVKPGNKGLWLHMIQLSTSVCV